MGRIADIIGTLATTFRVGKSTLDSSALTAARTHTLPDKSGAVALLSQCATAEQGDLAEDALPRTGGGIISGETNITTSGSLNTLTIQDSGGNGANILFTDGNESRNKYIRERSGNLEFINADYSARISAMTNTGDWSVTSLTETSDKRLKTNIRRNPNKWNGIRRKVEMVFYDRIDGQHDEPGVIAQEIQKFAPEFVGRTPDGILTVHYGKLALACALDPEPI